MTFSKYLMGPEMLWTFIFICSKWISISNVEPHFRFDPIIDKSWFYLAVLCFLSFGFYWLSVTEKSWLLLRLWSLSILVGHFALYSLMNAYSNQGPGSGMGYLAGMCLIIAALIAGSIVVFICGKL